MSTFRENKSNSDRSATDRSRHKKKIEKALKEGIKNIIADESIIGQDGKKKIRIPVRGIKEFRFIHREDGGKRSVGSAPGKKIKKGQKIGSSNQSKPASGSKPGDSAGEEYYDVEITLEELAKYLFDENSAVFKIFKFYKEKRALNNPGRRSGRGRLRRPGGVNGL